MHLAAAGRISTTKYIFTVFFFFFFGGGGGRGSLIVR